MKKRYGSRTLRHEQTKVMAHSEELEGFESEEAFDDSVETTGSYSRRDKAEGGLTRTREKAPRILAADWFFIALVSFALSLTFYALPLFNFQPVGVQSQYLYSGMAMQSGLVPYNDFWGAGGLVFYVINWIGHFGQTTWLLYFFQLFALFVSGVQVYRLILQRTHSRLAARITAGFTLVSIAGLAQGGTSPTLLALPFALWALQFLDRYLRQDVRDEAFIFFGMSGAFALVISPVMTVLWLLSALALFIFNIKNKRIGRGFYQLLATLFGVLLVGYTVAFYALNAQVLYTSIEQSIIIPLTSLGFTANLWMSLLKSIVFLLVFGLAANFVHGILNIKKSGQTFVWQVLQLIGSVAVLFFVLFSPVFESSNLLALLPLLLLFVSDTLQDAVNQRRNVLQQYMKAKLFAPILALFFVIGAPFVSQWMNRQVFSEEQQVAQHVKADTTRDDRVLAIAADKNINLRAQRVASLGVSPSYYPIGFHQNFDLVFANAENKYVIVQSGQELSDSVQRTLQDLYEKVEISNVSQFSVYKKK
nr:glycosyltransferase [Lactococcus ileimucosae]